MNNGILKIGEVHPSSNSAMTFIKHFMMNHEKWISYKESIASNSLSGNRLCEICLETIEKIEKNEPISDRYLLGLAWFLKNLEDMDNPSGNIRKDDFCDECKNELIACVCLGE